MGRRAFTTTLIFLGITLLGVFVRMFVLEDSPMVQSDTTNQTANTADACRGNESC